MTDEGQKDDNEIAEDLDQDKTTTERVEEQKVTIDKRADVQPKDE